jgi:uncharacterized damage-inducible protein DinB
MSVDPQYLLFHLQQFAVPWILREHALTVPVLRAAPPEAAGYRPAKDARSIWELAWHIAAVEIRFLEGVVHGEFEPGMAVMPEEMTGTREVADWYERRFRDLPGELGSLTPERLLQTLNYRDMLIFPALVFLQTAMVHTIHHRGQLTLYLRMLGVPVPNVYG